MDELNWERVAYACRDRFARFDERKRFAFALLQFYGTPYRWGNEVPEGADCSGAVCFALAAATGRAARCTADALYRTVFTDYGASPTAIRAAFFVSRVDKKEGGRLIKEGTATHVAGIICEGIALNQGEPVGGLRELSDLKRAYDRFGYDLVIRGLNREAYDRLSRPVAKAQGFDEAFMDYFTGETA